MCERLFIGLIIVITRRAQFAGKRTKDVAVLQPSRPFLRLEPERRSLEHDYYFLP